MTKNTASIMAALDQMSSRLETQRTRVGNLERNLDAHASHLDQLSSRIDASLARLESILRSGQ